MTKNLEKAKELLRQGELRITGILQFSTEIDNKIFKLLASSIAVSSAITFFLLKNHTKLESNFLYTSIFAIMILSLIILCLLLAGKPAKYKGVGLPLKDFDNDKDLEEILISCKDRYEARFNNNKALNKQKNFWLKHAIYLFAFLPIFSGLFYLGTLFFPVVIVIRWVFIFGILIYFLFRKLAF